MLYSFDLDGTLIDSREAVYASYVEVGVSPPADFFSRPWQEWLNDETLHNRKNVVYVQKIPLIKPLPLMELYKDLRSRLHLPTIMTGASKVAAHAIANYFNLDHSLLYSELTVTAKINMMNRTRSGIMFEDQRESAERMKRETRWTVCHTL
jgi:hypothetical protein